MQSGEDDGPRNRHERRAAAHHEPAAWRPKAWLRKVPFGRTKLYLEVKAGRIEVVKAGAVTLITYLSGGGTSRRCMMSEPPERKTPRREPRGRSNSSNPLPGTERHGLFRRPYPECKRCHRRLHRRHAPARPHPAPRVGPTGKLPPLPGRRRAPRQTRWRITSSIHRRSTCRRRHPTRKDGQGKGGLALLKRQRHDPSWTAAERAAFDAKVAARKKADEEKRQRLAEAARHEAVALFGNADQADPRHPYSRQEAGQAHGLRQRGSELLVPRHDMVTGELVGLQRILPDGNKLNLEGRSVRRHVVRDRQAPGPRHDPPGRRLCHGGNRPTRSPVIRPSSLSAATTSRPAAVELRRQYPQATHRHPGRRRLEGSQATPA